MITAKRSKIFCAFRYAGQGALSGVKRCRCSGFAKKVPKLMEKFVSFLQLFIFTDKKMSDFGAGE